MSYYVRQSSDGKMQGIWEITGNVAKRIDVSNAEHGPGSYFVAQSGETIWEAIARQTPWFSDTNSPFHKLSTEPDKFYPRIARPSYPFLDSAHSKSFFECRDIAIIARGQLATLMSDLDRLCRIIHPVDNNLAIYGHEIRNLLLLASTEVEAQWRGVLVANGVNKKSFSSKDYIKLSPAMRLPEYAVSFTHYPWLPAWAPFQGWTTANPLPTKSLPWYDAYNAVKHNREDEFARATLEAAFNAVSACVVMLTAQYGFISGLFSELSSQIQLAKKPSWTVSDAYFSTHSGQALEPINYPF